MSSNAERAQAAARAIVQEELGGESMGLNPLADPARVARWIVWRLEDAGLLRNDESVTPRDLLFTTIVEISEMAEMAGLATSSMVPTFSLVVWRERLKKVLNDGNGAPDGTR